MIQEQDKGLVILVLYAVILIAKNVRALDPDNDEQYVLTTKPLTRTTPRYFEPKQVLSAVTPNTFSEQ